MATALQAYSSRITGAELPRNGKPIVIVSYKVQDKGNGNYQAVCREKSRLSKLIGEGKTGL